MSSARIHVAEEHHQKRQECKTMAELHPESVIHRLSDAQLEEFRSAFSSFDADGGGSIDATELDPVLKSLGQEATKEELDALIKIADTDGSGDIDFEEFVVLVAHKMKGDTGFGRETIEAAFKLFDADGSGEIDADEMKRVMINLGEPMTLKDVNEIIHNFDQDGARTRHRIRRLPSRACRACPAGCPLVPPNPCTLGRPDAVSHHETKPLYTGCARRRRANQHQRIYGCTHERSPERAVKILDSQVYTYDNTIAPRSAANMNLTCTSPSKPPCSPQRCVSATAVSFSGFKISDPKGGLNLRRSRTPPRAPPPPSGRGKLGGDPKCP